MLINMKKIKIIIWFVFSLLITLQLVKSFSGTAPIFDRNLVLRGESSDFYFEIDNSQTVKQDCTYSMSGLEPLIITFNKEKITLEPSSSGKVYGTLSVPTSADIKTYKATLTVSCSPQVELGVSGSVVKQSFSLPFNVDIVGEIQKREIRPIQPEEKPKASPFILVLIIIVLILAIFGFYLTKKKKIE